MGHLTHMGLIRFISQGALMLCSSAVNDRQSGNRRRDSVVRDSARYTSLVINCSVTI